MHLSPPQLPPGSRIHFHSIQNSSLTGRSEVAIGIVKKPEKETAAEITTRNLDSDGWLGSFMPDRYFFDDANIEAVFTGLPNNPQLQIGGTISEVGGTGVPFPLTGKFSLQYSNQGIEISEFTWKSHERNQVTVTGRLPYDPLAQEPFLDGKLTLNGHIDFPALEDIGVLLEPWGIGKGSVVLDMDVNGSWGRPEGHILIQAENIEPPDTLKQYADSSVNFTCDIAAQGDSIVLKSANLNSRAYSAQATGSWKHGISINEFLQKRKAELKGELEADATVQLKDLNFLRDRFSWLRRIEGEMHGGLHVSGPVTNPSLKGSFSLKDGEISHTFNFPILSAVNLQGNFDERSLTIKICRPRWAALRLTSAEILTKRRNLLLLTCMSMAKMFCSSVIMTCGCAEMCSWMFQARWRVLL